MDMTAAISLMITGVVKPIILIVVIWFSWLLIRKKSAALQHFVLSMGIIGVLLMPILASFLPSLEGQSGVALFDVMRLLLVWFNGAIQWFVQRLDQHGLLVLAGIYLLPATCLLFYLLLGILGLHRQAQSGQLIQSPLLLSQLNELRELLDLNRSVTLMTSHRLDSPYTWGLWHPVIMLPREALLWDEDKQLSVLIHELGHIVRWDWLTTLLVKFTCACFWFLLPVWWLAARIFEQAEIACDDYVYKLRDKHVVYARNLLAIASKRTYLNNEADGLQMRGQSPIYTRIMAVLDKQRPHHPVAVETAQYWLICGGFLLTLFSCVQIIPLQEQLHTRVHQLLNVRETTLDAIAKDQPDVRTEQFSWALLQELKQQLRDLPAAIDQIETVQIETVQIETVQIEAAPLDKTELQEWARASGVQKKSVPIPAIHIQGFLPIDMVSPEYPTQALVKGIEGWVAVEFSIDTNGAIVTPLITAHSPSRIFDRSVLAALKKSRYRPQLLDGEPVIVQGVTEVFRFTLTVSSSATGDNRDDPFATSLTKRRR
jgi:bla regulator protein blaR1